MRFLAGRHPSIHQDQQDTFDLSPAQECRRRDDGARRNDSAFLDASSLTQCPPTGNCCLCLTLSQEVAFHQEVELIVDECFHTIQED